MSPTLPPVYPQTGYVPTSESVYHYVKKYVPLAFALGALVILLSLNFGETGLSNNGEASDALTQGDADCDGAVDARDALRVLRSAASIAAQGCESGSDNDCNGVLNSADALRLLRHTTGLPVEYTRGCPLIGSDDAPAPTPSG